MFNLIALGTSFTMPPGCGPRALKDNRGPHRAGGTVFTLAAYGVLVSG